MDSPRRVSNCDAPTSALGHAEAQRLLDLEYKLCELHPLSKRPVGNDWQRHPVTAIRSSAGGYGLILSLNGLCSVDPDNVDLARAGLKRCGFDLDEIMAAGVRTSSTRPGSGGRSAFKAPAGLTRVCFASKTRGTILELRAGQSNLQDCLPGTRYRTADDGPIYEQAYANGKTLDQAADLPPALLAWWQRLNTDPAFLHDQQRLLCGEDAQLAVSAGEGAGAHLAYGSGLRRDYNAAHSVEDILSRHGYTSDGERWAPPTATGVPGVRPIPGKDGLWRSDHASDPLFGTFDAWSAFVALDCGGDLDRANGAYLPELHAMVAEEFPVVVSATPEPMQRHPVALDWDRLPLEPPEPRFVIPGWMPDGVVTLFAAHGGTGKSFLSLYIALCIATGKHPFAAGEAIDRASVVLYSAEDDLAVMQWRLRRYMQLLGIGGGELKGWLTIFDATESDNVLFVGDEKVNGRTTARFTWLAHEVERCGAQVLIYDNASDAIDANENDRAKVRQFMSSLKRLASAVLLLAHVDAVSSLADISEAKGYSGSTAWHNSARSRWFMARAKDTDDVVLTQPKVNYALSGSEVVIRWSTTNKVFEVVSSRQGRMKAADCRAELLRLLGQAIDSGKHISPKKNAGNSVLNTLKGMDGCPFGLKPADVEREVNRWLSEGLVQVGTYRADNRTDREQLVLTEAGRALCADSLGANAEDFA